MNRQDREWWYLFTNAWAMMGFYEQNSWLKEYMIETRKELWEQLDDTAFGLGFRRLWSPVQSLECSVPDPQGGFVETDARLRLRIKRELK